ncbi:hypothetical protein B0H63DRAFT_28018 [Podospora didyma]|uniref:GATA-type domain-containing protein n=1 Tax=Podospora didyma TaxID=330526 RepID=A0AAE0P5P9_9PEZI|nr:hypothetical protein B0H63DRAFT_28018 [Podospora didyma]
MATMANHDHETTQPTCQNCATSTTPLWRRDEMGAVLCNACGLFLKLHGRPRPISLKTDIIKSRNRVKTMRPDLVKQKKQQQQQQQQQQQHNHNLSGTDLNGGDPNNIRRQSQKSVNGHPDDTNSPISRTGTPNMYNSHIAPIYHNIDDSFQSQQLPGFSVNATSPGRAPSPMNGERLDIPPSQEQLMALNASLKTRVSELEVIQELYRGRLQQLEQEENMRLTQTQEPAKAEAQLRAQLDTLSESHTQLQKELEESHRRENMLKRRLDELEEELKGAKESLEVHESDRHKKQRIEEPATLADVAAATTTPPSET